MGSGAQRYGRVGNFHGVSVEVPACLHTCPWYGVCLYPQHDCVTYILELKQISGSTGYPSILLSGYWKWAKRILWVDWWHPLEFLLSRDNLIFQRVSATFCIRRSSQYALISNNVDKNVISFGNKVVNKAIIIRQISRWKLAGYPDTNTCTYYSFQP